MNDRIRVSYSRKSMPRCVAAPMKTNYVPPTSESASSGRLHSISRSFMGTLVQDLAYAWRTLRRSPGFAAVAILTLGLGIGATTTIFTVVNGVLLRPLPSYREPERIASLWVDFGVGAQSLPVMSPGDFRDYQQRSRSFALLAAGSGAQVVGATGALTGPGGEPERVDVSPITANFLPLLGVDPLHGRHFTAEEEA